MTGSKSPYRDTVGAQRQGSPQQKKKVKPQQNAWHFPDLWVCLYDQGGSALEGAGSKEGTVRGHRGRRGTEGGHVHGRAVGWQELRVPLADGFLYEQPHCMGCVALNSHLISFLHAEFI